MFYAKINEAYLKIEVHRPGIGKTLFQFVFFEEAATLLDSVAAWRAIFSPYQIKKLHLTFHELIRNKH